MMTVTKPRAIKKEEKNGQAPLPRAAMRLLGDRVLVLRDEASDRSEGGILLPDASRNKPQRGTVLAVGPGKRDSDGSRQPPDVQVGDRVLFLRYAGVDNVDVDIEGASKDQTILLREEDVMAVLD